MHTVLVIFRNRKESHLFFRSEIRALRGVKRLSRVAEQKGLRVFSQKYGNAWAWYDKKAMQSVRIYLAENNMALVQPPRFSWARSGWQRKLKKMRQRL